MLSLVTLVSYASVMISYIFLYHSGKFAVLPTHGLADDKLVPAGSPGDSLHPGGVEAVRSGPGVHVCGNGAGESIG